MSQPITLPPTFIRCTAEEGTCPLRETCLRSTVHRETIYSGKDNTFLRTVNLWNKDIQPFTENCEAYLKAELKNFAQGFKHLFDCVPKAKYAIIQNEVQKVFGNRRTYFYCKKGEQLVSPEEQQRIAQIFKNQGIEEEPQYDNFVEVYAWN